MMKKRIYIEGSVLQHEATGIAKYLKCIYKEYEKSEAAADIFIYNASLPKLLLLLNSNKLNIIYNLIFLHVVFPLILIYSRFGIVHLPWNGRGPWFIPKKHSVVSTVHDVLPCTIQGYFTSARQLGRYKKKIALSLRRSDIVVTDSVYSKNSIFKHFGYDESYVVPLASTIEFDINAKLPDTRQFDCSYYVYVGGYDKRKGLDCLLQAHKLYAKSTSNPALLIMIGKVYYHSQEFYDECNDMKTSGLLLETGYISDHELAALLLKAKALVYPSRYEGFGLPPLEAMGLGCPVLTTHQTSLKELCSGATLELPNVNDTSDFAERIKQIVHDDKLREQLRKNGTIRAEQYTWKQSAKKFSQCLNLLRNNDYH